MNPIKIDKRNPVYNYAQMHRSPTRYRLTEGLAEVYAASGATEGGGVGGGESKLVFLGCGNGPNSGKNRGIVSCRKVLLSSAIKRIFS